MKFLQAGQAQQQSMMADVARFKAQQQQQQFAQQQQMQQEQRRQQQFTHQQAQQQRQFDLEGKAQQSVEAGDTAAMKYMQSRGRQPRGISPTGAPQPSPPPMSLDTITQSVMKQNPNMTPQALFKALKRFEPTLTQADKMKLAQSRGTTGGAPTVGRSAYAQSMRDINSDPKLSKLPMETKIAMARGLEKGTTIDPETGKVVTIEGAGAAAGEYEAGKTFGKEMGQTGAEAVMGRRQDALDSRKTMFSNMEARRLLDSGMITGFGAEYITGLNKILNQLGFKESEDAVANTEAYVALRAQEVGRIIKLFGAGTGLSDADREYAEKAAAGKITLNEESLRRIIEISDKVSYRTIHRFGEELKKIPQGAMPYDLSIGMEGLPEPYWGLEEGFDAGFVGKDDQPAVTEGLPQGWSVAEVQ